MQHLENEVGRRRAARMTQPAAQRLSVTPASDPQETEAAEAGRKVAAGGVAGPIQAAADNASTAG